jgi:hypothetical protein
MANLTQADKEAVRAVARNLRMDPNELGALILQESGFRPNVWGGGGNNYYGLIQFGGPERQEVGLNPNKIGNYTVAEQMPHVERFFRGRGFKPGMGIQKAYATVLGGNPNANIYAQDSNKTSVASAAPRMARGGDLYKQSEQLLGASNLTGTEAFNQNLVDPDQPYSNTTTATTADGIPININISLGDSKKTEKRKSIADIMSNNLLNQVLQQRPLIDPMTLFQQMGAMFQ